MTEEDKSQEPADEPEQSGESAEKPSRFDNAKAFFRALSAGEVDMSEYGMNQESATSTACSSCEQLNQELVTLTQKSQELEAHYKRMAADFENYRKRVDRDRDDLVTLGMRKVLESLLPALDDIERAQSSLNASMSPEKILEGLSIVATSITRCLDQLAIKPLKALGEPFDPRLHEPVQQIETTEFPDNHVMQELRRGYTLNDKVIRPALVNVASNSSSPTPESAPADEDEKPAEGVYDLDAEDPASEKVVEEYLDHLQTDE